MDGTQTGLHERGSHSQQEISETAVGANSQKEKKKINGTPKEKGIKEGAYVCIISHSVAWWRISGSESSEGDSLGSFIERGLVLPVARRCWV